MIQVGYEDKKAWKLVDKIKNLGKDVTETAGTADRQTVKQYKDFELTEDVATGEIQIFKTSQSDEAIDRLLVKMLQKKFL